MTSLLEEGDLGVEIEPHTCCICLNDHHEWTTMHNNREIRQCIKCTQCARGFICEDCIIDAAEKGLLINKCPVCRHTICNGHNNVVPIRVTQVVEHVPPGVENDMLDQCDTCCLYITEKCKLPLIIIGFLIISFTFGIIQIAGTTGCGIGCFDLNPVNIFLIITIGALTIAIIGFIGICIVSCVICVLHLSTDRRNH
jgi:hypothetical protein